MMYNSQIGMQSSKAVDPPIAMRWEGSPLSERAIRDNSLTGVQQFGLGSRVRRDLDNGNSNSTVYLASTYDELSGGLKYRKERRNFFVNRYVFFES